MIVYPTGNSGTNASDLYMYTCTSTITRICTCTHVRQQLSADVHMYVKNYRTYTNREQHTAQRTVNLVTNLIRHVDPLLVSNQLIGQISSTASSTTWCTWCRWRHSVTRLHSLPATQWNLRYKDGHKHVILRELTMSIASSSRSSEHRGEWNKQDINPWDDVGIEKHLTWYTRTPERIEQATRTVCFNRLTSWRCC